MRLFICTLRDSASESFHAPLFFPAIGMAERWFKDEINSGNPESGIARHPEDYELTLLGAYDTSTAEIVSESPRILMRGLDALKSKS